MIYEFSYQKNEIILTKYEFSYIIKMQIRKFVTKEAKQVKISLDKIEIARARNCMTVSKLAEAYGVSRARMNTILNQRELTPVCVGRLASALGVDVTEIIED